jgi:uncharacterized C2H2 Zn-finger protein
MADSKYRKQTRRKREPVAHCPRCDKPFVSKISFVDAVNLMKAHVKKAHPTYWPMMEDD